MSLRLVSGVAIAAIALSACEPVANEPPPPPPTEATGQAALEQEVESPSEPEIVPAQEVTDNLPKVQTAKIEWAKARQDFAAQNSASDETLVTIANAGELQPPVPVLLPTGGPVSIATGGAGPRFKQTADGYYAVYPYENYDVIVNGTNEVIGTRGDGPRDETMKYTATAAGAQVSLSRYGADYLVEFECYTINPATGTCIEEDEAIEVAESLVIRGTR